MAEITAGMVKALREKTDAPMMDCKKALTEADGDMDKAEEILRVRFGNKAAKSAGPHRGRRRREYCYQRRWQNRCNAGSELRDRFCGKE